MGLSSLPRTIFTKVRSPNFWRFSQPSKGPISKSFRLAPTVQIFPKCDLPISWRFSQANKGQFGVGVRKMVRFRFGFSKRFYSSFSTTKWGRNLITENYTTYRCYLYRISSSWTVTKFQQRGTYHRNGAIHQSPPLSWAIFKRGDSYKFTDVSLKTALGCPKSATE